MYMKIIITERQYSLYLKRRYHCIREYIDQLKSGEEKLRIPIGEFKWDTYKYLLIAGIRSKCGNNGVGEFFDEDVHNEIMGMFGDELYEIYKINE